MSSPFDRALESSALRAAAEAHALQHGPPGTRQYRSALRQFLYEARLRDALSQTANSPASVEPPPCSGLEREGLVRQVLDAAIKRAMRIDGAPKATAQLSQPRSDALRLVAQQGFSAEFLDFFKIVNDTTTACGSALKCGAPVLISDITNSPVFADTVGLRVMLRAGSRAVASLPVRAPDGRVIAMISTHHPKPTTWTRARIEALGEVCGSTGLVLHHVIEKAAANRPGD